MRQLESVQLPGKAEHAWAAFPLHLCPQRLCIWQTPRISWCLQHTYLCIQVSPSYTLWEEYSTLSLWKCLKTLVLAIIHERCFHNAHIWEGFSYPRALYIDSFEPWMERDGKCSSGRQENNRTASQIQTEVQTALRTALSEQCAGSELLTVLQQYLSQLASVQLGNLVGHRESWLCAIAFYQLLEVGCMF